MYNSLTQLLEEQFQQKALYKSEGGSARQDVTLQNIQARCRMVIAYMMSQIIPEFVENGQGFIMVLASANLDE